MFRDEQTLRSRPAARDNSVKGRSERSMKTRNGAEGTKGNKTRTRLGGGRIWVKINKNDGQGGRSTWNMAPGERSGPD